MKTTMSSPSPGSQSGVEHPYQPSDSSDHALLTPVHICQCADKSHEVPKCDPVHFHCNLPSGKPHHHHLLNHPPAGHTHPTSQSVHAHVHHPPASKAPPPTTCNCHLQGDGQGNAEMHPSLRERKLEAEDRIEVSPLPPALPPRPPPRPRLDGQSTLSLRSRPPDVNGNAGIRKYVFWCCACGGLATILGALFLAVYFLLRSYTSTLGYFETVPTVVPAAMLILTGLCVISLARRKNRYSYLIKVCGVCCLACALTCVLVTITTTVIHMNRLQTLRECVYTQKTRTCTCYSVLLEAHASADEGMRFVFDSTPDCEVIHGALYSCLRAMFGLSVSGILVCIFSCMLIYQLLSHEKKKMYWEQLELRCRSLYQQHGGAPGSTRSSVRGPPLPSATYCSCCEECRYPSIPTGPQIYPWDAHALESFWAPGRVGNFYSPNPGEEGLTAVAGNERTRAQSGWSWRRLPWSRGNANQAEPQREQSLTYQGGANSSDSQYGFGNRQEGNASQTPSDPVSGSTGSYSVLDNRPVGGIYVWGPPPPYSNPNSPARRPFHSPTRYHHIHHHPHAHNIHCQMNQETQNANVQDFCRRQLNNANKDNYENTVETEVHRTNENSESTDTSSCVDHVSHTLPVRKLKKRADIASVKSVAQMPNARTNVQNVFPHPYPEDGNQTLGEDGSYQEADEEAHAPGENPQCRFLPRLQGVENAAFQNQEGSPQKVEPTESEVYFADVSSCCNISVKNDGQDSSLYDEAVDVQNSPRLTSLQKPVEQEFGATKQILQNFQENISSSTVTEDEEYLAHRLSKRHMSTRSRLPFPLPANDGSVEANPDACAQLLPKDLSQNSLCSSAQTPVTDTTDDTISPTSPSFPANECCLNYFPDTAVNPEQRHRTFASNASLNQFLAPDAQYEVIQDQSAASSFRHNYKPTSNFSNLTNTISSLNNYSQNYLPNAGFNPTNSPKNVPPKTLNLAQPRKNLGSNISTLIQNLGVNSVELLYGESHSMEEEDEVQGQGCHSDGTMDSGWQSGSEKQERTSADGGDKAANKAVNV